MKIVTDKLKLKKVVPPSKITKERVEEVSNILKEELENHSGFGLSTNQLGIDDVRACIINVIEPMVLINPRIIEQSDAKVVYIESCLSLPKTMRKPTKTVRSKTLKIDTDNLGVVEFKPDKMEWENAEEFWDDEAMLECVCAQHEIDHLNGKLITDSDRQYSQTRTAPKKYGRNERVMVKLPDGKTEFMKYKKAIPFLEYGAEIL